MLTEAATATTVFDMPELPLMRGRLRMCRREGALADRPYLAIEFACPWCRTWHCHTWAEDPGFYDANATVLRRSHCRPGMPLAGTTYLVGTDPYASAEDRRTTDRARQQLRRWEADRRMSARLADERSAARAREAWPTWSGYDEPGMKVGVRNGPPRDRLAGWLGQVPR